MANKKFNPKILAKSVWHGIAESSDNEAVFGFYILLGVIAMAALAFTCVFSFIFIINYTVPYLADYVDYLWGYSNEFKCTQGHSLARTYELFLSKTDVIREGCGHGGLYLFLLVLFLTLTPFMGYVGYQIYRSITRKYNEEMAAHTA